MQDALAALQQDVNGYLAARYEEGREAVEKLDATEAATAARRPAGGGGGGLWPFGRGSRCEYEICPGARFGPRVKARTSSTTDIGVRMAESRFQARLEVRVGLRVKSVLTHEERQEPSLAGQSLAQHRRGRGAIEGRTVGGDSRLLRHVPGRCPSSRRHHHPHSGLEKQGFSASASADSAQKSSPQSVRAHEIVTINPDPTCP